MAENFTSSRTASTAWTSKPIAVTIAKLRFFISLIIEQESNDNREANYGIRPLPNLETKLVAANTLIGLNRLQEARV